jgi:hypothetical protein
MWSPHGYLLLCCHCCGRFRWSPRPWYYRNERHWHSPRKTHERMGLDLRTWRQHSVRFTRRLKQDRSHLADEFDMKYFFDAIKDWKIWVHMFTTIGVYTGLYSVSLVCLTVLRIEQLHLIQTHPNLVLAHYCEEHGFLQRTCSTPHCPSLRRRMSLHYRRWFLC